MSLSLTLWSTEGYSQASVVGRVEEYTFFCLFLLYCCHCLAKFNLPCVSFRYRRYRIFYSCAYFWMDVVIFENKKVSPVFCFSFSFPFFFMNTILFKAIIGCFLCILCVFTIDLFISLSLSCKILERFTH